MWYIQGGAKNWAARSHTQRDVSYMEIYVHTNFISSLTPPGRYNKACLNIRPSVYAPIRTKSLRFAKIWQ